MPEGGSTSDCHLCHIHDHAPGSTLLRTHPLRASQRSRNPSTTTLHRNGHHHHHHMNGGHHSRDNSILRDTDAKTARVASALARLSERSHSLPGSRTSTLSRQNEVSVLPDGSGHDHGHRGGDVHSLSRSQREYNNVLSALLDSRVGSLPSNHSTVHREPDILNALPRTRNNSRASTLTRAQLHRGPGSNLTLAQDTEHDYYTHINRGRYKDESRKQRFNIQTVMLIGCYTMLFVVAIIVGVVLCQQNGWLGFGHGTPDESPGNLSNSPTRNVNPSSMRDVDRPPPRRRGNGNWPGPIVDYDYSDVGNPPRISTASVFPGGSGGGASPNIPNTERDPLRTVNFQPTDSSNSLGGNSRNRVGQADRNGERRPGSANSNNQDAIGSGKSILDSQDSVSNADIGGGLLSGSGNGFQTNNDNPRDNLSPLRNFGTGSPSVGNGFRRPGLQNFPNNGQRNTNTNAPGNNGNQQNRPNNQHGISNTGGNSNFNNDFGNFNSGRNSDGTVNQNRGNSDADAGVTRQLPNPTSGVNSGNNRNANIGVGSSNSHNRNGNPNGRSEENIRDFSGNTGGSFRPGIQGNQNNENFNSDQGSIRGNQNNNFNPGSSFPSNSDNRGTTFNGNSGFSNQPGTIFNSGSTRGGNLNFGSGSSGSRNSNSNSGSNGRGTANTGSNFRQPESFETGSNIGRNNNFHPSTGFTDSGDANSGQVPFNSGSSIRGSGNFNPDSSVTGFENVNQGASSGIGNTFNPGSREEAFSNIGSVDLPTTSGNIRDSGDSRTRDFNFHDSRNMNSNQGEIGNFNHGSRGLANFNSDSSHRETANINNGNGFHRPSGVVNNGSQRQQNENFDEGNQGSTRNSNMGSGVRGVAEAENVGGHGGLMNFNINTDMTRHQHSGVDLVTDGGFGSFDDFMASLSNGGSTLNFDSTSGTADSRGNAPDNRPAVVVDSGAVPVVNTDIALTNMGNVGIGTGNRHASHNRGMNQNSDISFSGQGGIRIPMRNGGATQQGMRDLGNGDLRRLPTGRNLNFEDDSITRPSDDMQGPRNEGGSTDSITTVGELNSRDQQDNSQAEIHNWEGLKDKGSGSNNENFHSQTGGRRLLGTPTQNKAATKSSILNGGIGTQQIIIESSPTRTRQSNSGLGSVTGQIFDGKTNGTVSSESHSTTDQGTFTVQPVRNQVTPLKVMRGFSVQRGEVIAMSTIKSSDKDISILQPDHDVIVHITPTAPDSGVSLIRHPSQDPRNMAASIAPTGEESHVGAGGASATPGRGGPSPNTGVSSPVLRRWEHTDDDGILSRGLVRKDGSFAFTNCRPSETCDNNPGSQGK
ncbi:hypothetical protein SK128_009806 [Halocaridina rubra]|uniref:Uncharacterized protein n=1 Tax=Halocaridina rubra TaxID=373956 RepID=A0AAN8WYH2_HALRR